MGVQNLSINICTRVMVMMPAMKRVMAMATVTATATKRVMEMAMVTKNGMAMVMAKKRVIVVVTWRKMAMATAL